MGLGHAHEQRRRELLAAHRDGDLCPRCDEPMYAWQDLDADHVASPRVLDPDALPDALSHAPCNRRHGALLQQAIRGHERRERAAPRAEPIVTSRDLQVFLDGAVSYWATSRVLGEADQAGAWHWPARV